MTQIRYILILLIFFFTENVSAKENIEIERFMVLVGDSINQLNEEQVELLDFAIDLLIKNDSVVVLPQELNLLIGDTAKVNYCAYPDWNEAFFEQKKNKTHLTVPIYAETSVGIIHSQMNIERKKTDKFKCVIETSLSIDSIKQEITSGYSGVFLLSEVNGVFVKGEIYRNGSVLGTINGEKSNIATELKTKNHIYPRFENLYYNSEHYKNKIAQDTYRTFRELQEKRNNSKK